MEPHQHHVGEAAPVDDCQMETCKGFVLPDEVLRLVVRATHAEAIPVLRLVNRSYAQAIAELHGEDTALPMRLSYVCSTPSLLNWALTELPGSPRGPDVCTAAARSGGAEALAAARKLGCRWDASTCAAVAAHGDISFLKTTREQSCPWDARSCASAAGSGCLEVPKKSLMIEN